MNPIEFSAKADRLVELGYYDEDESHTGRNIAAGGALAAGGFYGGRAISKSKYGKLFGEEYRMAGGHMPGEIAKQAWENVKESAPGQYAENVKGAYERGVFRGQKGMSGVLRGLRGAARFITKGKSKAVGLSAKVDQLIQL